MERFFTNALKASVFTAGLVVSGLASANNYNTLSLPTLNTDLRTWTDGSAYGSLFPSSQTFDNVPFELQLDANGNNAFVGTGQLDITVGMYGATDVFTLINTAVGSPNALVGSVSFYGSDGATYSVDLIEGGNVRDHYYGSYVNYTNDSYVSQAVFGVNSAGHAHLDMQDFVLPPEFGNQTLTHMVFNSTGGYSGNPFLVGATAGVVSPVPELDVYAMMLSGLGLLGVVTRRRRKMQR